MFRLVKTAKKAISKLLRDLATSKIQITIIQVADFNVRHTVRPRTVVKDSPTIIRRNHSKYRFKQLDKVSNSGEVRTYYYTEVYDGSSWGMVDETWFADKNKAMEAHTKTVNGVIIKRQDVETILWEGLSAEEATVWVELNKEQR
jgi:hypothetical protein